MSSTSTHYCNETVSCQVHKPHILVIFCKFVLEIVNSFPGSIWKFHKPWNAIPISTLQNLTIFIHFFGCSSLANKYNHAKLQTSNFMFSYTTRSFVLLNQSCKGEKCQVCETDWLKSVLPSPMDFAPTSQFESEGKYLLSLASFCD